MNVGATLPFSGYRGTFDPMIWAGGYNIGFPNNNISAFLPYSGYRGSYDPMILAGGYNIGLSNNNVGAFLPYSGYRGPGTYASFQPLSSLYIR